MPSKRTASMQLNITSPAEELMGKFMHGLTPWLVWLAGVPAGAAAFRMLAVATRDPEAVAAGLAAAAVVLTWLVRYISHQRSATGRHHHSLNMIAALGLVAAVAYYGPTKALLIFYAVAGLTGALAWNIRYTPHSDGVEDVLTGRKQKRKAVDVAYLIRLLSGWAPFIRVAAEKTSKVVPAVAGPWREPSKLTAGQAGTGAGTEPPAVSAQDAELAQTRAIAIKKNFADLTTHKIPDLAGARLVVRDVKPWRIHCEVVLVRGVHTPKVITGIREEIASQCAMPLASVVVTPNPKRHDRVFLDFVLENVLRNKITWPGPLAAGQSIAAAPCRIGIYEDRQIAERFGPAITDDMAKALRRDTKNLSHVLMEGMNGAGKSTLQRVQVTDAATRTDIEEWLIDTVKQFQTFGKLGRAFSWFATTKGEAVAMIKFLADQVIPARANYLGLRGYDNWVPGCGLPYLRLTVEEGGIIFNELEKLDAVLMAARSSGVEIDGSIQRAHSALMDTNVRAQFAESASFGCKSADDAFVLPDELAEAGADPSQWANKQPGMCYWASSELDLEQMLMPLRGFDIDTDTAEALILEHVPAREQWIAENCPDWQQLLADLDRNGVHAKRTTGAAVYQKIAARTQRTDSDSGAYATGVIRVAEPIHSMRSAAIPAMEDPLDDDDSQEAAVTLDELDLDPEIAAEAVADFDEIDPAEPIPEVDPADDAQFPRPESGMTRDQSLRVLRGYLTSRGPGFEFSCSDIYNNDDLFERIGRSAGWIRGEIASTLVAEGFLAHDAAEGKYTVQAPRLTLAPEPARAAG